VKINCGKIVKRLREEKGMRQEELANKLHITDRQLRNYETENAIMDIWQFMYALELLGYPEKDFWLFFLDSDEYKQYRVFRQIKRLLRDRRFNEAKEKLRELEKGVLAQQPLIKQFIARVKIKVDKDIKHEDAIEKLKDVMCMSITDFDESKILEYRLTNNEVNIITDLASRLSAIGETSRALALQKALIQNIENSYLTEDDKADLLPSLMSNHSTTLGKAGKFKECKKICEEAIEICKEYNNLFFVPKILYVLANSIKDLGEEEQIFKPYIVRAYIFANTIGDFDMAKHIKKDAEKEFGIIISDPY
jgi:transcriptional regulator with XRE-family HTH domain